MLRPKPYLLRLARRWLFGAALLLSPATGWAATLTLEDGRSRLTFDAAALLARPDATEIEIPADNSYGGVPRRYRAVPLAAILSELAPPPGSILEAAATDGFAAQIPLSPAINVAGGGSGLAGGRAQRRCLAPLTEQEGQRGPVLHRVAASGGVARLLRVRALPDRDPALRSRAGRRSMSARRSRPNTRPEPGRRCSRRPAWPAIA